MREKDMKEFGRKVAELREKSGKSQAELVEILGVTQQTLSRYEKGERQASLDFVVNASKYFGVSADYLLGITEDPTTDPDTKKLIATSGLSEKSIKNLIKPYQNKLETLEEEKKNPEILSGAILFHCECQLAVLNAILESRHFYRLLAAIWQASSFREKMERWGKDTEIFLTDDENQENKTDYETAYNAALLHVQRIISWIIEEEVTDNAQHHKTEE